MGYFHRILKAKCGKCSSQVVWTLANNSKLPNQWKCKCGARNLLRVQEPKRDIPLALYLGHDNHNQMKVYAVPPQAPGIPNDLWAQPYSIRSFVCQASNQFGGCYYATSRRGEVMEEAVYSDRCSESDDAYAEDHPCHMVAGWTLGEISCPLRQKFSTLCQTEGERRFLHTYLNLVKDRHFPMLLPQARLGIAERRRPDFVAYVPLQVWKYLPIAVELDTSHTDNRAQRDDIRDMDLTAMGFQVIRVKPADGKTIFELKKLVETIESLMTRADQDIWSVAVELEVTESLQELPDYDIPF